MQVDTESGTKRVVIKNSHGDTIMTPAKGTVLLTEEQFNSLMNACESVVTVLTGGSGHRNDAGHTWDLELYDICSEALARVDGSSSCK